MGIKGNQAPVLSHFKYLYSFFIYPVFYTAIPAVVLVKPYFAGSFAAANRALQYFSPSKKHLKPCFIRYYVHLCFKKCGFKKLKNRLVKKPKAGLLLYYTVTFFYSSTAYQAVSPVKYHRLTGCNGMLGLNKFYSHPAVSQKPDYSFSRRSIVADFSFYL